MDDATSEAHICLFIYRFNERYQLIILIIILKKLLSETINGSRQTHKMERQIQDPWCRFRETAY